MKRWSMFAFTLGILTSGLVLSQRREVEAPVGPNSLLYFVADAERELTRLPMKYTRISDADEIKIGDEIAKQLERSEQDDESKGVEAYLRIVGSRVAAKAERKLPYKFHYIPSRYFVNAFAIPGGHVYVGAGLMDLMESEDALAAVLGHEIEHIDHYHCADRIQFEAALRRIPLGQLVSLPAEVFQAGYNKDKEIEADREGTRLSVKAGYSPQGAIEVFSAFQRLEEEYRGTKRKRAATPQEEISGAAVQVLTGYFLSHPPAQDRVAMIQQLIAEERWTLGKATPLAVRYIFLAHQAEALVGEAKYDKAIKAASAALQLHPGHPPALVALAQAACATQDFHTAATAYHELLANHQAAADAVRAFAEQLGSRAMEARHFIDAGRFAAFSLELQPNNAGSLKLLAEVKLELDEVSVAEETGLRLQKLYPQVASELVQYADNASDTAFQEHKYARAAKFAAYTLRLEPSQSRMQTQLASCKFALADFRAAADVYRKVIAEDMRGGSNPEPAHARAYADSLGSLTRQSDTVKEFQAAIHPPKHLSEDVAVQLKMEEAGLLIMSGDDSMARALTGGTTSFAPERAARLGWWYYRAGKFEDADKLLHRYLDLRPGDGGLQITLGWVELEENKPGDAMLHRFQSYASEEAVAASGRAGRAIAHWRLQQGDPAMSEFADLIREAPEWTNPIWVRALYGPVAAQSIQEMKSEQQRRNAAHR